MAAPVETVLYRFLGGSDGSYPYASLIADKEGALYGTTPGGGTAFRLTPPTKGQAAWTETVLYSFKGGSDGQGPQSGLTADNWGALYGTAGDTVFKLTPPSKGHWTETVLHSFTGSDGSNPSARLIADKEGALYGTTIEGGSSCQQNVCCQQTFGCGTVFKLTPPDKGQTAWTETVLHSFLGGSDGKNPRAGLIFDKEGALYGTTQGGGTADSGTVFKLNLCPNHDGCPVFVSEE